MKKRIDKPVKAQTAITFISGSAGEIDWVLPILYFLLNKGFNLKIIFLTRHARKSVEKNRMLNDFILYLDIVFERLPSQSKTLLPLSEPSMALHDVKKFDQDAPYNRSFLA